MADAGIPDKLLPAIRLAVFWISLPFIGLLLGGEDIRTNSYYWALGWFFTAILSIVIAVYWNGIIKAIWPKYDEGPEQKLAYLRNTDSELGAAIRDMSWRSAWGRWYAAQLLATNNHVLDEGSVIKTAASLVEEALMDGRLEARGRKPGAMDYEVIPSTHWRSTALFFVKDNITLWKMILVPRGGAEITPDGTVIGHDAAATNRTDQLAGYDSLIINSRRFENLWPLRNKKTDRARMQLLKQAKKAGADPEEILKLSQDDRPFGVGWVSLISIAVGFGIIGSAVTIYIVDPKFYRRTAAEVRFYTEKTVEELSALCSDATGLQCISVMKEQSGKWINAEGKIQTIWLDGQTIKMQFFKDSHPVTCNFGQKWKYRLSNFHPFEVVKVTGEISVVQFGTELYLQECELRD